MYSYKIVEECSKENYLEELNRLGKEYYRVVSSHIMYEDHEYGPTYHALLQRQGEG